MNTMTVTEPIPVRQHPAWTALEAHAEKDKTMRLAELFETDPTRGTTMTLEACGIHLDYSKNLLTDETLGQLLELADQCGLREHIDAIYF